MWLISGLVLFIFVFAVYGISSDNGRYEDISIVIQDSVEENETLLERIQEVFTKTSQTLFQATRQHVYFGHINIILPKTWSNKPGYLEIPARSELETYITVESGKVKTPHTKRKKKKCGHPGRYIYLHTEFLLTEGKTKWGHHENVLLHEWGHLRWGLFEEYSTNKKERFYLDNGLWNPVRCNSGISGHIGKGRNCKRNQEKCDTKNTGYIIDEKCKFCPYELQSEYNMSSIMAFNWVDGVSTFCDNEEDETVPNNQRHNSKAPNKHNLKCNGKSAWEIMRQHSDFETEQLPENTDTTPVFSILHETYSSRVFVLDTSGSMVLANRIQTLYQAAEYIIQAKIPDNSWLGIVWFESSATTHMDITQVTSQDVRNALISALPQTAGGGTCIGCGIDEALRILRIHRSIQAGSEIIVISDGQDNDHAKLDTSVMNAKNANVIIHSISVSDAADTRMISMATITGGNSIAYLETGTIGITSTFMEVLSSGVTSYATESTTLKSEKVENVVSNSASYSFDIDSSIGKNTTVSILHGSSIDLIVDVVSPSGKVYTEQSTGNNIILDIPGTAEAGKYNFTVTTLSTHPLSSFEYYVTSLPTSPEVIRISSWVSPIELDFFTGELPVIEADVMKGRASVLNAHVTAVTETASSTHCNVSLLDDGIDPDDTSDDGVYAGVIPRFCLVNGRISAKVYASGVNGTASVQDVFSGAGSSDSDDDVNNTEILQDSFQRVALTNDFLILNYSNVIANQDVTAPGQITDVSIIDISTEITDYGESRNFTITWTATGDDMNLGLAKEYEFRIFDNRTVLVNNFSAANLLDVVNLNFTPKVAGTSEYLRIEIDAKKSYTSTTFFGVRAIDEAGNAGDVSNTVSILVANGYRIKVEGDVVYSYTYNEEGTEEYDVQEKKNNFTGLAIGLSSAAVVILGSIIAAFVCLKKLKAKESVEDSEFGSRASTTTVFSIDKPLKDFFTSMASRQTVAKKTFMSSQLPTIPEREQIWTNTFSKRPISPYSRKPFDIISQGECSIEMLDGAANEAFSDQMEGYLNVDNDSIFSGHMSSRSTCSTYGPATTNKSLAESESDMLPAEATETKSDVEKNQCKFLSVVEGFANENERQTPEDIESNEEILPGGAAVSEVNKSSQRRKKGFKREPRDAYSEERSVTCSSLSDFPAFDSNEISREISKMYEDVHFEQ